MYKIFNKNYKDCENIKFDLIFTDIPYNIGNNAYASRPSWWKNGNVKEGKSEHANSLFFATDDNFNLYEWLSWCSEHLKENGRVLTFCSIEQIAEILGVYKKFFKNYTPLVFIKNRSAEVLKTNLRIVGACEYGIVLYKNKLGKFNNNGKMVFNWFNIDVILKKIHPSQKPINICKKLISLYADTGDFVCDTCMGIGTIVKACKELNIDCYGFEIEEKYYNIAKEYIEQDGE